MEIICGKNYTTCVEIKNTAVNKPYKYIGGKRGKEGIYMIFELCSNL